MTKRLTLTLILTVIFSSLLFGCTGFENKEKKISEVTNIQYSDITKIVFFDGRGKNNPFTLNDKNQTNDFIKMMDRYVIKKEKKHDDFKGWIHSADFYNGDKKLMSITFTDPLEIDGNYYDIVKGQLSTEKMDNFIQSANPDWKLQ
ncbi:hypothetical protein [Neobacillus sp.]|uniref:hypothetical protein n=1 Tax=Neobacillus sp. TaxID=2675273 RepID=UPI00289F12EB|nr:hypothetical protein [Neobacillus sp.]